jgi:hypothetical protein
MNHLEQRYRLALRLLPAEYRRQWEDDMVAAFLASTHDDDPERAEYLADFGRPSWSEVGSVAALAFRLHLGLAGAPSPRAEARSDMLRIVIRLWLLAGAVWAVVAAVTQLWFLGVLPGLPGPVTTGPPQAWWQVAVPFAGLAWPVAYLALLFGRTTVARVAAVGAVAVGGVGVVVATVDEIVRHLPSLSVSMVATSVLDVCLLAALWTLRRVWPPVPRRGWLVALVVGVLAVTALFTGAVAGVMPWWALDWVTVNAAALLVLVAVRLVAGASPSWSLALAVLAWAMVGLRILTLADVAEAYTWVGPTPMVFAVAEALALGAVAVPMTVVALRTLARLATSR